MPELSGSIGRSPTGQPTLAARAISVGRQSPSGSPSVIQRALPGMVARGHGLETLCLYLKLAQAALFDVIVALGLPTPDDRPHRRAGGRNPWQPDDVSVFIVLWTEGWAAASLAERFGRSRCAIWSKARQLGLPRRERHVQFRPANPHAPVPPTLALQQGWANQAKPTVAALAQTPPAASVKPVARPAAPVLAKSTTPIVIQPVPRLDIPSVTQAQLAACLNLPPITRKGGRQEIRHSADRDLQLALRHFGSQHYVPAAREMGMSPHAYLSRRRRLCLKPMQRGEFVDEFNPEWAAAYIQANGFKRVQCRHHHERGIEFYFWCKLRETPWFSPVTKQSDWYKNATSTPNHIY